METAEARVDRGVDWLDAQPELEGWRDRINRDTIDMADPALCIAGQAVGGGEWPPAPDWWQGHYPESQWTTRGGYTRLTLAQVGHERDWDPRLQGFMGDGDDDDVALKEAWLAVLASPVPANDEG
jgi:hypothetical protein